MAKAVNKEQEQNVQSNENENKQEQNVQSNENENKQEQNVQSNDNKEPKKSQKVKLKILVAFTDKNNDKIHYNVNDEIEFSVKRAEELLQDTRRLVEKVD